MNKKDSLLIYSQKLAGYLMFHGFVLINSRKDSCSNRNVFFFNKSDNIQKCIEEYKKTM